MPRGRRAFIGPISRVVHGCCADERSPSFGALECALTAAPTGRRTRTGEQLVNIPRGQAKLILDATAPGGRFGGNLALNWVGDLWANLAVVGRVNYGNYAVVNLGGYAFLDDDRRHRVSLRLENALDADYDSAVTRARTDVTDVSYAAGFRGTPITLHVGYRISL